MKTSALFEPKPLKAFRDKYLAAIMMVAVLLITSGASAQTDSAKYSRINGYGFGYKRFGVDSILMVPLSNSPHTPYRAGGIRYNPGDSTLQLWTGHKWNSILTGGTGIDTAYTWDDSTIAIVTPNETFLVRINGQNLANAALTATGNYIQNWNRHQLIFDTTKDVRIYSYAPDLNFTNNNHTFLFEHYHSVIGGKPLSLNWALRDVTNSFDSVGSKFVSDLYSTYINNYTGSNDARLTLNGSSSNPSAILWAIGSKTSQLIVGNTITIDAPDSTRIRLNASAAAAGDSAVVTRNYGFGLNTLVKVPMPAGGSATLSNAGSGFRLVKTSTGAVKTTFAGYGIIKDSTSNTDGITDRVDTSSTNHLVTQSDLNDVANGPAGGDLAGTFPNPTVANNAVTDSKLRQSAALSIIGRSTNSTGNVADITAGTDNQVMRRSGTAIGWGAINLASSNAVTGVLPVGNTDTSSANHLATQYDLITRQESYLGSIYNNNTWSNLSDFTQTGSITAAASAGKINLSAGAGTFTQTLDLNYYSMLERWKATVRFKITAAPGGSTYGIGIGIHSTNSYGAVNALGRIDLTNTASGGQLFINGHTSNAQLAASATNLPIASNDTIVLTVERKVDSIIVCATNISQSNAKVRVGYKYDITSSMTAQLPNTGRFAIFSFGGSQSIDSLSITSNEVKNSTLLVIGDSKTQAYYADVFSSRFASQLDNTYQTTVLHAGGFDRTTEWVTYLPEIKALNPKQVLLTNPSNDARSGVSSSTSHAQYQQVVDSLTSWGIEVYHALAFYESSQDNSAWNTYIISTFTADQIIDTWNPTKNCTGCIAGDGIHLTKKGNDTVYTAIKETFKIKYGNARAGGTSGTGTTNTIPMFSASGLTDSYIYQDANRVYMSKGFESSTTDPGFDLYKTNASTDEKGWNVYSDATSMYVGAFNDGRNAVNNAIKINRTGTSINYTAITNGNLVVGATSDPGTYPLSVIASGASLTRFRTSNTAGGYIGFENGTTPKGYIGYGSVLTTGASDNDVTLRSQSDVIHFSDNAGTRMMKIDAGKLSITSIATGSSAPTTSGTTKMVVTDANGQLSFDNIPSGSDLTGGAVKANIHIVNDADYTLGSTDYIVLFKTMTAGRTLTLPAASSHTNRMLIIKHGGNGAFNITTSVSFRESSGVTGSTISQGQSVGLCSDGTDWWVLWIQ